MSSLYKATKLFKNGRSSWFFLRRFSFPSSSSSSSCFRERLTPAVHVSETKNMRNFSYFKHFSLSRGHTRIKNLCSWALCTWPLFFFLKKNKNWEWQASEAVSDILGKVDEFAIVDSAADDVEEIFTHFHFSLGNFFLYGRDDWIECKRLGQEDILAF